VTILWLSWKDIRHPQAGGAERVGHEWRRRLQQDGHEVRHVTARYPSSPAREHLEGIETIRCGTSALGHYPAALAYLARHTDWPDVVIEEVNTVPYGSRIVRSRARTVLLYFQLAREIWFHQTAWPVAVTGYAAEAVYTRLQALGHPPVITISEDSRRDLATMGFAAERVHVAAVGIDNTPLTAYEPAPKTASFTVLFHSSLRAMKRPRHALEAFHIFASDGSAGQLWMAGGGSDAALRRDARRYGIDERVTFFGRTSEAQKLDLMQRATVLVATSVKEGWGLIVTEANSMGTPAVVYDVDGLRAAAGTHNWIAPPDPAGLAARLRDAARVFAERPQYDGWCARVLQDSRGRTHDASYAEFRRALTASLDSPHG
jgi:glycosyltransferase involved in cell wall biosynthesis